MLGIRLSAFGRLPVGRAHRMFSLTYEMNHRLLFVIATQAYRRMLAAECRVPVLSRLLHPSALNLDEHIDQRDRRWRHSGNAAGVTKGAGAHAAELLVHLARQ